MVNNQKGFSAIEAVIILIVVVLLALGGWYAWKSNKDNDGPNKITTLQSEATPEEKQESSDPTEGWVSYSNEKGQYSFKHPGNWVMASDADRCDGAILLMGPTQETAGSCRGGGSSQFRFGSGEDDGISFPEFKDSYFKDVTETDITVQGVVGKKYTATIMGWDGGIGAEPDNTKVVRYVFYTNNRRYVADYTQQPSYPALLNDFNTVVTESFKFTK